MEIKPRTMLDQAIDVFKKYIETKGNLETDYHLEEYMQVILDYINDLEVENKRLKMINEEYERLNKNKYRGFKIIDVQEYDKYELLSYKKYKDNWNKLKEYIRINIIYDDVGMKILDPSPLEDYMQKLEQGSDSNVKN